MQTSSVSQPSTWVFAPPGATWVYKNTTVVENSYRIFSYVGDTIINGQLSKKLSESSFRITGVSPDTTHFIDENIRTEYIFQDGDEVYWYNGNYKLIYDFSKTSGEWWEIKGNTYYQCNSSTLPTFDSVFVNNITTEVIGNKQLDIMQMGFSSNWYLGDLIIKGIGSRTSFYPIPSSCTDIDHTVGQMAALAFYSDFDIGCIDFGDPLLSCSQVILSNEDDLNIVDARTSIFPNPVKSRLFFSTDCKSSVTEVNIYNIQGVLLASFKQVDNKINLLNLPNGLLIVELVFTDGFSHSHKIIKHE